MHIPWEGNADGLSAFEGIFFERIVIINHELLIPDPDHVAGVAAVV